MAINKRNAITAKRRLRNASANLAIVNILLILNGSALEVSRDCSSCCAPGGLHSSEAGLSGPLNWAVNGFSMGFEAG